MTAEQSSIPQSTDECLQFLPRSVRGVCLFLRAKEEIPMARKVGQIIKKIGVRLGNSLTPEESQTLWQVPRRFVVVHVLCIRGGCYLR